MHSFPTEVTPGAATLSGYDGTTSLTPTSPFNLTCTSCGGVPGPTLRLVKAGTPYYIYAEGSVQDPGTLCTQATLEYDEFGYHFPDGFQLRCLVIGFAGLQANRVLSVGECLTVSRGVIHD